MRKGLVLLVTVVAFALLAGSCTAHVTGGGFIEGNYDDTANFGFNFKCEDGDAKGQLTYHDGDLKIKGTITSCSFVAKSASGYWRPQGPSEYRGGKFYVKATDNGEPGIGEDWISIKLYEGRDRVYYNHGKLLGGNIQEH